VVRVPGYRSRGPGFDFRRYHIFWEVVGLERGPLSLVSTTEELLGRKSSVSGLEIREYGRRGFAALTAWHPPLSTKLGTNIADKRRFLGRYSSLADSCHGVYFSIRTKLLWYWECQSQLNRVTVKCPRQRRAHHRHVLLHMGKGGGCLLINRAAPEHIMNLASSEKPALPTA
jgi:hypothetical protein